MKPAYRAALAIAVALAFAGAVLAADTAPEVTVTGMVQCAKCTLKAPGAKECQDVLVVPGKDGAPATEYYLTKNAAWKKYGHVCHGEKSAVATGTVAEKDGKKWLTVTKIEVPKG